MNIAKKIDALAGTECALPKVESRITILVHSMNAGGAQQRLVALANGFAAAGRRVDFVAVSARGLGELNLAPEVHQVILMHRRRGRPKMLRGRRELENYLREAKPTVLLAGSTTVHLIAVLATRALERPPALILRASRHPDRPIPWSKPYKRLTNKWRRATDYWLYDQADRVVAVSHEVGATLRAKMRHPEKCLILPNPVVTEAFLESLRSDAPHRWLRDDNPVVLGVGRLVWQKNFATLIDAMAKVMRTRPAKLILVGEGKLRAELEEQAARLGISEHVAMPGHVGAVAPWMKHADLLVSSSRYEGSPGVLIEALAAGCPVVATRCPGGSVELLHDGLGGILVPMCDAEQMAAAIEQTLQRQIDRKALPARVSQYCERQSIAAYLEAFNTVTA